MSQNYLINKRFKMNANPRYYCPKHLLPVEWYSSAMEYVCKDCGVVRKDKLLDYDQISLIRIDERLKDLWQKAQF